MTGRSEDRIDPNRARTDDPEFNRVVNAAAYAQDAIDHADEVVWFWLSFFDPATPGLQFVGACLVQGVNFLDAITNARDLEGYRSDTQVQGVEMPAEIPAPEKWRRRMLSEAECLEMDAEAEREGWA